jgi:hypothetical protein
MKNMTMKKKIEKLSILNKRAFETGDLLSILIPFSAFMLAILLLASMNLENFTLVIIIFLAPVIIIYWLTRSISFLIISWLFIGTALGYKLGIIPLWLVVLMCIVLALLFLRRREQ